MQPHAGAARAKARLLEASTLQLHPPTQEERVGGGEVSQNSSGALVERKVK